MIGRTYALQLLPSIQIISWSPLYCHLDTDGEVESALEDCTPFHDDGRLLLTMGCSLVDYVKEFLNTFLLCILATQSAL